MLVSGALTCGATAPSSMSQSKISFLPSETGTNDKPGGPHYILRWTSPQAIKETHVPLTDWRYAYMQ